MRHRLGVAATAFLSSLAFEAVAAAQDERPVVVDYVAPSPECPSTEAFQAAITTQMARAVGHEHPARLSVRIRPKSGGYEGTVTTERAVRTVAAARCEEVTAALALVIANATPFSPTTSSVEQPAEPAPTPPAEPRPPVWRELPPKHRYREESRVEFRFAARADVNNHAGDGTPVTGGFGVASIELPWGFRKMMFEVAGGAMSSVDRTYPLSYVVLDTQACLIDVPLGATGLSLLGCLRVAGASYKSAYSFGGVQGVENGGALWTGGGGRLRWQTPWGLFLEAQVNGVYGTVSSGESTTPGWLDLGASAGFRL